MLVIIAKSCIVGGKSIEPSSEVVDVDVKEAKLLIRLGRAKEVKKVKNIGTPAKVGDKAVGGKDENKTDPAAN